MSSIGSYANVTPAMCASSATAIEIAYFSAGDSSLLTLKLTKMSLITTTSYRFARQSSSTRPTSFDRAPDECSAKDMGRCFRAQSFQLLKSLSDITKDRSHSQYAPGSIDEWQDSEFNRDTCSIFS